MINDTTVGGLLLLFSLLAINILEGPSLLSEPDKDRCGEKVFAEISGDVTHPGVYGFYHPPSLRDLLNRAGGLIPKTDKAPPATGILYHSGSSVDIRMGGKKLHIVEGEMSAFYRITLGLPISVNKEPVEGLTAVSGIGPKIAGAIVRERTKRGGFLKLREILSVRGVGPKVYRKIHPYLTL